MTFAALMLEVHAQRPDLKWAAMPYPLSPYCLWIEGSNSIH